MENETKKARHTFTVYDGFKLRNQELDNPRCREYKNIGEAFDDYHALIKDLYKIYEVEFCCGGRIRKDLVLAVGMFINYEEYDEEANEWIVIASGIESAREYDYAAYRLDKELDD